MKIWIINNYNMLPQHGALCRSYYLGKYLKRLGHEPTVFVGSHPHNTNLQLIMDKSTYKISDECDFPWVLVKTIVYHSSTIKRIYSMFQFYFNMLKTAKHFEKPDVIIGSSAHPLAAVATIKLARKYGCQCVAEIRDLWPESIVAYGIAKKYNPSIKLLYHLEKWIYTKADKIVFTMEGGKDYIIEKGWDREHGGPVDLSKVYHINNGVDLETFDYNRESYAVKDADLENPDTFKVVYTGSIRKVNDLGLLLDAAKMIRDHRIKLLIWGDGNELAALQQRVADEGIVNVVFKGQVGKNHVPSIVSQASLNILHGGYTPIMRYGASPNKLFEYLAAGKPILSDLNVSYDVIKKYRCGQVIENQDTESIAEAIIQLYSMQIDALSEMADHARLAAKDYDYQNLAQKLIQVIAERKV